jgi:hypothetical protein
LVRLAGANGTECLPSAGVDIVWPQYLALFGLGSALFAFALWRFRKVLH